MYNVYSVSKSYLQCFQDLGPWTGIAVQLHNVVRQPLLAGRKCSDLTIFE